MLLLIVLGNMTIKVKEFCSFIIGATKENYILKIHEQEKLKVQFSLTVVNFESC